jgi:preprotein translocase subunit SecE
MAVEVARPGLIARGVLFYHEVMTEMRKVTWPDRAQLRQATIAIIVFVLIIGAIIGIMDLVLQGILVNGIPSLFAGGR